MNMILQTISAVVRPVVMGCWVAFGLLFLLRRKYPTAVQQKRDTKSLLGVAIAGAGYFVVWSRQRPSLTPLLDAGPIADAALAVAAMLLSIVSVWLVLAALRVLGRQWSIAARLVDDHRLVREGPYSMIRHPIYTGMLGMMIATGLAFSIPPAIAIGALLGWYGTHLRIQSEETLLREAFGETFDEYSRQVPALIPWIHWIR